MSGCAPILAGRWRPWARVTNCCASRSSASSRALIIDFQTVLRAQQSGGYFGGFEYEPVGGVDGIDDVSEQVEFGLEIQADF